MQEFVSTRGTSRQKGEPDVRSYPHPRPCTGRKKLSGRPCASSRNLPGGTRAPFPAAPPANPPPIDPRDPARRRPRTTLRASARRTPAAPPQGFPHSPPGCCCHPEGLNPLASPLNLPQQPLAAAGRLAPQRPARRRLRSPRRHLQEGYSARAWQPASLQEEGPAGREDRPRGAPTGSRLPEVTRRAILYA